MHQHFLTAAAGKRLIGLACAAHPAVREALVSGTLVVVAGSTNGYAAEEILRGLGQEFDRAGFLRGVTRPPAAPPPAGPAEEFPGDVVIVKGTWEKGKTIFDVADGLREGDVILKGANALDPVRGRAAVLVGHPEGGTIHAAVQAVVGHRARLILPVGLEKRVCEDLDALAALMNAPGAKGPRLYCAPGEALSELDAVRILTGARARLVAAGGVSGAEGGVWLAVEGGPEETGRADGLLRRVKPEPPFAY